MTKLEYTVSFTTPAFLGNAEQQAQWRTPPFKALLRQWWRVANARSFDYKHENLRKEEGRIFGNAWLQDNHDKPLHNKSQVRLRIEPWAPGSLTTKGWPGGPIQSVITTADGRGRVRADVYLGYGPVLPASKKDHRPEITIRGAIQPKQGNEWEQTARLRLLTEETADFQDTVQLIAWFGTIGSRSRNGWGSIHLASERNSPAVTSFPSADAELLKRIGRPWEDCLGLEWPHAIGLRNGKPLLWISSRIFGTWRDAIGFLAEVRVGIRRKAKGYRGPAGIGGIHLLGYPAGGKWELAQVKKGHPKPEDPEGRLAGQLRFKVCASDQGLRAIAFHLPHRVPNELRRRLTKDQLSWLDKNEILVWSELQSELDRLFKGA